MNDEQVYYTHYEGDRPFKVVINKKYDKRKRGRDNTSELNKKFCVEIYSNEDNYDNDIFEEEDSDPIHNLIKVFLTDKVYIGKSGITSLTENSRAIGSTYDGNTIILEIKENYYLFIGHILFFFKTFNEINEYYSPVGFNDIPFPYAIDSNNNIYLLVEDVIVTPSPLFQRDIKFWDNPYDYYYRLSLITPDYNFTPPLLPISTETFGIKECVIENESYSLKYSPNPSLEFDILSEDGKKISIIYQKEGEEYEKMETKELSKEEYINLVTNYGIINGITPLKKDDL